MIHTDKVSRDIPDEVFLRVKRLGRAKENNLKMCDHVAELCDRDEHYFGGFSNSKMVKLYHRMEECGSWLQVAHYIVQDSARMVAANFCGTHLLCQACAIRRGILSLNSYTKKIDYVLEQNPGLEAYMLTITVKNGPDLIERFDHLQRSFKVFQKRRRDYVTNPSKYSFTEFSKIEGAVFSYEVTRAKDGETWHPHIHMLILCESPPKMGRVNFDESGAYIPETSHGLRNEFYLLTGDSFMLDCRRDKKQPINNMCMEVMKYAVKFSSQSVEDTWFTFQKLSGRRLFGSFGNLHGVKIPANLLDAKLTGAYIEYIFNFNSDRGLYDLSEVRDMTELYEGYTPDLMPEASSPREKSADSRLTSEKSDCIFVE